MAKGRGGGRGRARVVLRGDCHVNHTAVTLNQLSIASPGMRRRQGRGCGGGGGGKGDDDVFRSRGAGSL